MDSNNTCKYDFFPDLLCNAISVIIYLSCKNFILNTKKGSFRFLDVSMVGATGFEPTTSWSRTKRSTKLSYAPFKLNVPTKNFDGRSSRIRTCDPLVPSQVLYQTEPCPVFTLSVRTCIIIWPAIKNVNTFLRFSAKNFYQFYVYIFIWISRVFLQIYRIY